MVVEFGCIFANCILLKQIHKGFIGIYVMGISNNHYIIFHDTRFLVNILSKRFYATSIPPILENMSMRELTTKNIPLSNFDITKTMLAIML